MATANADKAWVRGFIESLASAENGDRCSLHDLAPAQHEALAGVVSERLSSHRSSIRRAAAWVVGELDRIPEDAPILLGRLLTDHVTSVRMTAAWACGKLGDAAHGIIPDLINALQDPNDGVRFAVVCSLGDLGSQATCAVNALLSVALSKDKSRIRDMAVKALADIAPDNPDVQRLLVCKLQDASSESRFFAAYGIGQADHCPQDAASGLAANLDAIDPYLIEISVWALGKIGMVAERATPAILTAMKRLHWMQIEHSEVPAQEFISIRPVFCRALEQMLPPTDDADYEDFRLRFFSLVFHPTPLDGTEWIDEIVSHRWYLKLQRRRFGHPATAAEREAIRQMVCEAQAKLATRLWKNPTLGLRPEKYKLLPGFIKNHARNIAWRIRNQKQRSAKAKSSSRTIDDVVPGHSDQATDEMIRQQICDFIDMHVPEQYRDVARCRWALELTIAETAAMLELTPSQVKTREGHARAIADRHLKQGDL